MLLLLRFAYCCCFRWFLGVCFFFVSWSVRFGLARSETCSHIEFTTCSAESEIHTKNSHKKNCEWTNSIASVQPNATNIQHGENEMRKKETKHAVDRAVAAAASANVRTCACLSKKGRGKNKQMFLQMFMLSLLRSLSHSVTKTLCFSHSLFLLKVVCR